MSKTQDIVVVAPALETVELNAADLDCVNGGIEISVTIKITVK